jgi:PUA domain protein
MKRKILSNKEIRDLNEQVKHYNYQIDKKDKVEIFEDKHTLVKVNDQIMFFYLDGKIVPSLKLLLDGKGFLKRVSIDMGAVKFIVSGADVMRPGIVEIDDSISKDEIIVIVDVNNKKPLALGKALLNGAEMKSISSGKAIKNLHYVGDEIWRS